MRSGLGQGGLGVEVREELEGGGEGQSHAQTRAALHSAGTPQPAGEARGDEARPLACGLGVIEAEGSNVLRVPVFRTPRDREGVTKSTRQRVVGGDVDNHSGEEEASVVLYARCRLARACCAGMCSNRGRPRMQEWPNAEQQGDCGLHGRYMKA